MSIPAVPRLETIRGLSDALQYGELTCLQIVEQCLRRIDEREPQLRAWVMVDRDGAREQARRLDDELRAGASRGPLHGIPIAIKDIVDVAGFVTGAGSPFLSRQPAAGRDAAIVTALREAGAVILGKTVTTQFACFDPPPTRNPWNPERTPGGSSSGSAAAVGAGLCPAAIGSQTGGSITRPASFCGAAGCKPTHGTVPLDGIVPLAPSMDHPGPIARTVEDLALVLAVLQGSGSHMLNLDRFYEQPPRLGRLRGFLEDKVEPVMQQALDEALQTLRQAGADVVDVAVPEGFADVLTHHRIIMAAEAAAWHRDRYAAHRDDYGPCITSLIEDGLKMTAVDYIQAREQQTVLARGLESLLDAGLDALVTPATTGPAPDLTTTGNPGMNAPWSYTGQPTVSFPIGLTEDGLPLAIQLAGIRHLDFQLLEVGVWCERVLRPV